MLYEVITLPRWVESSGALEPQLAATRAGSGEADPPTEVVSSASRSSVESLLARLIRLRERLEASAVERWAQADYTRAKEIEGRGDAAFLESYNFV